jgi:metal-responsive CopG/Arc/MetJ family transcriptional regulator
LLLKINFYNIRDIDIIWWHIRSMKVETSITLSEEILRAIKQRSHNRKSRSDFIENALWKYINYLISDEQNKNDFSLINKHADRLNKEAKDVLEYQDSL